MDDDRIQVGNRRMTQMNAALEAFNAAFLAATLEGLGAHEAKDAERFRRDQAIRSMPLPLRSTVLRACRQLADQIVFGTDADAVTAEEEFGV